MLNSIAPTAVSQAQDGSHLSSLSSYDSLVLWAEKTLAQAKKEHGEQFLDHFERDRKGNLKTPDAVRKLLEPVAYDVYADQEVSTPAQRLNSAEQEEMLKELATLTEGDACRISAQSAQDNVDVKRCPPLEALEKDKAQAKRSHFFILPHDLKQRRAMQDGAGTARLSLSVSPRDVVAVAKQLISLFPTSAGFLENFKIIAACEQGKRTDSIVVYLNRADPELAQKLATQLIDLTNAAVWQTHTPFGMEFLAPGIAYAEFSPHAKSGSFGAERSAIVAEALLLHLEFGIPIKEALEDVLKENGYSVQNPAVLSGS